MTTEIEKAYKAGYDKGYKAGRRKVEPPALTFHERAFLAALPSALSGDWRMTWKGEPVSVKGTDQRVELAWRIADRAASRVRVA